MLCISSSIEKLFQQQMGGFGVMDGDTSKMESDSIAVDVLRRIEKRLKAERITENREEVRLLSKLLREEDHDVRFKLLKEKLDTIERLTSFDEFLRDGIKFLRTREEEDYKSEHRIQRKVELPVGTIERMKDIQVDMDKLMSDLPSDLQGSYRQGKPRTIDYDRQFEVI